MVVLVVAVVSAVIAVSVIVDSNADANDVMVVSIDACGVAVVTEVCVSVCVWCDWSC